MNFKIQISTPTHCCAYLGWYKYWMAIIAQADYYYMNDSSNRAFITHQKKSERVLTNQPTKSKTFADDSLRYRKPFQLIDFSIPFDFASCWSPSRKYRWARLSKWWWRDGSVCRHVSWPVNKARNRNWNRISHFQLPFSSRPLISPAFHRKANPLTGHRRTEIYSCGCWWSIWFGTAIWRTSTCTTEILWESNWSRLETFYSKMFLRNAKP